MSFVAGLLQSKVTVEARTTISSCRNSRSAVVVEREKYLDQVHRRLPGSKAQHSEHEKQRDRDDGREQQRAWTAQAVREEEKHRRKPCAATIRRERRRQPKTLTIVNRSRFEAR
jgi:hypothetical protein